MTRSSRIRVAGFLAVVGPLIAALVLFLMQDPSGPGAAQIGEQARQPVESRPEPTASRPESLITAIPRRPRAAAPSSGVMGHVIDDEGAPVGGALVTIEPSGISSASEISGIRLATDGSGGFAIEDLSPGRYDVVAEASGFGASGAQSIAVLTGRMESVDLVLRPAPFMAGRVVDSDGRPVLGAQVVISYAPAAGGWKWKWQIRKTSDAEGWFWFWRSGDSKDLAIDLAAHKEGVGDAKLRAGWYAPLEKVVTLKLKQGTAKTRFLQAASRPTMPEGSVLGAVPDLVVQVIGTDGRRVEGVSIIVNQDPEGPDARLVARTDPKGEAGFALVRSQSVLIDADPGTLPRGTCVDDDFKHCAYLGRDDRAPVVMRLRPEVVVRGVITLEDGSPVAAGTVALAPRRAPVPTGTIPGLAVARVPTPFESRERNEPRQFRFRRTGPDGAFILRVGSLNDYEVVEVTRVVQVPGQDRPVLGEMFAPINPSVLRADGDNRVVVRRKD